MMRGLNYTHPLDEKKRFLIIYDICDDRRRSKLARLFESYGVRVQMSAFEFCLAPKKYKALLATIPKFIGKEDTVRFYPIRKDCDIITWGDKLPLKEVYDVYIA